MADLEAVCVTCGGYGFMLSANNTRHECTTCYGGGYIWVQAFTSFEPDSTVIEFSKRYKWEGRPSDDPLLRWESEGGTIDPRSGDLTAAGLDPVEEVRGTPAGANPVIDTESTEGA